jgi:Fe-S-cluster containining protein
MAEPDRKSRILEEIYAVYGGFADSLEVACTEGCARCCTPNVLVTSLEGRRILRALTPEHRSRLLRRLRAGRHEKRFRPKTTTNGIAERCRRGLPLPEEERCDGPGACRLLENDRCLIYSHRPFACRCLFSRTRCWDGGTAEVDDFLLSVNLLFQQTIEHVDAEGCTGNLLDVLLCLGEASPGLAHRACRPNCTAAGLVPNRPLTVLMIPPHHRDRLRPIIAALRNIHT